MTRDEYRDVLLPSMRTAAEAGDVRMLFVVGPDFERFELGALAQNTKARITLGIGHAHAWKRTALVMDVDWIAKALHMFAWLVPGGVELHELEGLADAKTWLPVSAVDHGWPLAACLRGCPVWTGSFGL